MKKRNVDISSLIPSSDMIRQSLKFRKTVTIVCVLSLREYIKYILMYFGYIKLTIMTIFKPENYELGGLVHLNKCTYNYLNYYFAVIFIFLILRQDKINNIDTERQHQRVDNGFQDLAYRDFNHMPKRNDYSNNQNILNNMENNKVDDNTKQELQEARARIDQLEKKIAILEGRIPQKYPDVKYLGYKERKRILVK